MVEKWSPCSRSTFSDPNSVSVTALNNSLRPAEFTDRYEGLMRYYGLEAEKIQAGHGNAGAHCGNRLLQV